MYTNTDLQLLFIYTNIYIMVESQQRAEKKLLFFLANDLNVFGLLTSRNDKKATNTETHEERTKKY